MWKKTFCVQSGYKFLVQIIQVCRVCKCYVQYHPTNKYGYIDVFKMYFVAMLKCWFQINNSTNWSEITKTDRKFFVKIYQQTKQTDIAERK